MEILIDIGSGIIVLGRVGVAPVVEKVVEFWLRWKWPIDFVVWRVDRNSDEGLEKLLKKLKGQWFGYKHFDLYILEI